MDAPQTNPIPTNVNKSHTGALVSLAVIITLIVAGGGVYAWQYMVGQEKDGEIQRLTEQVDGLNSQVEQLYQEKDSQNMESEDIPISLSKPLNEFTGWQSYDHIFFHINYPTDWNLTGEIGELYYESISLRESGDIMSPDFIIYEYVGSIDGFIFNYEDSPFSKILNSEKVLLGSTEGVRLEASTDLGLNINFILVEKDVNVYFVIEYSEASSIHKQIISSFRLINDYFNELLQTDISTWQIYSNKEYGYTFKIPSGWRYGDDTYESSDLGLLYSTAINPAELFGDSLFAVNIFDNSSTNRQKVIDYIGWQFKDREVKEEEINFNNINATKVIVTTPSKPNWHSESLIFEKDSYIFNIINGAIKMDGFEKFYNTFQFTN